MIKTNSLFKVGGYLQVTLWNYSVFLQQSVPSPVHFDCVALSICEETENVSSFSMNISFVERQIQSVKPYSPRLFKKKKVWQMYPLLERIAKQNKTDENNKIQRDENTVQSPSIWTVTHVLLFWLGAPAHWFGNEAMTLRLKCWL